MKENDFFENERDQIDQIGNEFSQSLISSIIKWVIRWIIGFGIIGIVTHYVSDIDWLWYVGYAIAGLSLISMIISNYIIKRKIKGITDKVENLSDEFEDIE